MKTLLNLGLLFCITIACNTSATKKETDNAPNDTKILKTTASNSSEENKDSKQNKIANKENMPVLTFMHNSYDFGTINEGQIVKHTFKFKNTGKTPLVIENASAPCGCTVPAWPKEPIAPNEEGEIKVEFNSTHKSGVQNKTVTITANTEPGESYVHIKVVVNPLAEMRGPVKN